MSVHRPLAYLAFAAWVAVCAAAPEFIWQGLLALLGHFSRENVYSIVLIGLILTVFVEPILERAREGRWAPEHRNARSLLLTAPIAFAFGLVAVGLHECMTAFLGSDPQLPGPVRGFSLILEWAWIPLAVTLAWFAAWQKPWIRLLAGIGTSICVVGVGWYYAWPSRDIAMTSIPCIALIPLGQIYLAREWGEAVFRNLGLGLAAFIATWMAMTLLLQQGLGPQGIAGVQLYAAGDFGDDFRFYLGWAIGLAIAPHPERAPAQG